MVPKTKKPKKGASRLRPSRIGTGIAQDAFESLRGEIEALPGDDTDAVRVNVQLAAAIAHSVAVRDREPARSKELARLERGGFYDVARVDRVAQLALAAWFAHARQLSRIAVATGAAVPEAVLKDAQQRKARMFRVLEYWVGDDPEIEVELAAIRTGTGYQDLANDLEALAELYQREGVREAIAGDGKNYRADDVAAARKNVQAIFAGLGLAEDSDAKTWTDNTARAWTLLSREYEELRRCGTFIFGQSEDVSETYPSLVAAVRAPPRRDESPSPTEPATTPAGASAQAPSVVDDG